MPSADLWVALFEMLGLRNALITPGGLARSVPSEPMIAEATTRYRRSGDDWIEAMLERLVEQLSLKLSTRSESELVPRIDDVLRSGDVTRVLRPLLAHPDYLERHSGVRPIFGLSPEAADIVRKGTEIQIELVNLVLPWIAEFRGDNDFDAFLLELGRDPLSYLSELPVELARLMLTADRGRVAGLALLGQPASENSGALARLFFEGSVADARLFASIAPELVPLALVPQEDRLDIDALREEASEARRQLDALFAAAEESGLDFYEPSDA